MLSCWNRNIYLRVLLNQAWIIQLCYLDVISYLWDIMRLVYAVLCYDWLLFIWFTYYANYMNNLIVSTSLLFWIYDINYYIVCGFYTIFVLMKLLLKSQQRNVWFTFTAILTVTLSPLFKQLYARYLYNHTVSHHDLLDNKNVECQNTQVKHDSNVQYSSSYSRSQGSNTVLNIQHINYTSNSLIFRQNVTKSFQNILSWIKYSNHSSLLHNF